MDFHLYERRNNEENMKISVQHQSEIKNEIITYIYSENRKLEIWADKNLN